MSLVRSIFPEYLKIPLEALAPFITERHSFSDVLFQTLPLPTDFSQRYMGNLFK